MYTDPQIYNPEDESKRGFISFYYQGKRYRFYNGKPLGIDCFPNLHRTFKERGRLLKHLQREFSRALTKGWTPESQGPAPVPEKKQHTLIDLFHQLSENLLNSSYSKTYRRDLNSVAAKFLEFLEREDRIKAVPNDIQPADVERFLLQFGTSGTYYQNKRRTLTSVFSKLVKQGHCSSNPVLETSKRKAKAVIHQAYTPEQLNLLLPYLKEKHPNLYLCALLMYGTVLRPHQEIRLLKRRHFNSDLSQFTLDGHENKSGRIRSLPVPAFVKQELMARKVNKLEQERNVFTEEYEPFNESYFNTLWGRAKPGLLSSGLITVNQTLYSFRHAASINVFKKTQNLKLLQQLFDHSNLNTTLIYLRSIGVVQIDNTMMPDLLV